MIDDALITINGCELDVNIHINVTKEIEIKNGAMAAFVLKFESCAVVAQ